MKYKHRNKVYELTEQEIEDVDKAVNKAWENMHNTVVDSIERLYEKGVDEIEEKTRVQYEGKLFGAALTSAIAKAKYDYKNRLEIEVTEGALGNVEDYRAELLAKNYADRLLTE